MLLILECDFTDPEGFVTPPQQECVTVDSTAGFGGVVEICITYDDTGLDPELESVLGLMNCAGGLETCGRPRSAGPHHAHARVALTGRFR